MVDVANSPIIFKFIPNDELLKELIKKATSFNNKEELDVAKVKEAIEAKKLEASLSKKKAVANATQINNE